MAPHRFDVTLPRPSSKLAPFLEGIDPSARAVFDCLAGLVTQHPLARLDTATRIPEMGTPHQYAVLGPRSDAFEGLRAAHGSVWAFHGSRGENWFPILRNGLRNASGTALQTNGAAYGPGVYLSPAAAMSFPYSGINNAPSSQGGGAMASHPDEDFDISTLLVIAIVEVCVVGLRRPTPHIWVQPNEGCVSVRFLFAYHKGYSEGSDVTLTAEFQARLTRILEELPK